jgi:purine-binding chemotaxis protein CheW
VNAQRRTDLIVEELRRLKAAGKADVLEELKRTYVIFSLHDGLYAFEGAAVTEILLPLEVFPIPGAPPAVPGVINNRGEIEAVISLHGLLGLPASQRTARSRIVMAEQDGVRSGIEVDSVVDVAQLSPGSIKPPLATLTDDARQLVIGETTSQDRSVVLLDIGRIFELLRAHGR